MVFGEVFYVFFLFDMGIVSLDYNFWDFFVLLVFDFGGVGLIWGVFVVDLVIFNGLEFVFIGLIDDMFISIELIDDVYIEVVSSFMILLNNVEVLFVVCDRGVKIMVYYGVSDVIFLVLDMINWYNNFIVNYNDDVFDFVWLYLMLGMGYCFGGVVVD